MITYRPATFHCILIAVVSLTFGAAVFSRERKEDGDTASYMEPARRLLAGQGFTSIEPLVFNGTFLPNPSTGRVAAETVRTPGYPVILAAFQAAGVPLTLLIVVQHLLNTAMSVGTYVFVRKTSDDVPAALAAAFFLASFPAMIVSANVLLTETTCAAAVFASFICAAKALRGGVRWAAASGLLIAFAVLIRPVATYLFIPVALLLFFRSRRRVAATLVFVIAAAAPMAIWAYRNYRHTGVPAISSITGEAILFYRAAGVMVVDERGLLFGLSAFQREHGFLPEFHRLRPRLVERAFSAMRADGYDPLKVSHARRAQYFGKLGIEIIAARPVAFAALSISSLMSIFLDPYWLVAAQRGTNFHDAQTMFIPPAFMILIVAAYGLLSLRRRELDLFLLLAVYVLYFTLTAAAIGPGEYRMIVPFAPMYAMCFGYGVSALTRAVPAATEPRVRCRRQAAPASESC